MQNTPTRGLGKTNLVTGGLGDTYGAVVEAIRRFYNGTKRRFFAYYNSYSNR